MLIRTELITVRLLLSTCCLLLTTKAPADEHSAMFSSMTIFGDSSEDTGNWNSKAKVIAPSLANPDPPYMDGRFSNGRTWTEHLAESLGMPIPTASELDGEENTNYAWGAATTGAVRRVSQVDDIDEQLPKYLRDHTPAEDELFVVFGRRE